MACRLSHTLTGIPSHEHCQRPQHSMRFCTHRDDACVHSACLSVHVDVPALLLAPWQCLMAPFSPRMHRHGLAPSYFPNRGLSPGQRQTGSAQKSNEGMEKGRSFVTQALMVFCLGRIWFHKPRSKMKAVVGQLLLLPGSCPAWREMITVTFVFFIFTFSLGNRSVFKGES